MKSKPTVSKIAGQPRKPFAMTENTKSLSYKDAGVDIDAGNALIEKIKGAAKKLLN